MNIKQYFAYIKYAKRKKFLTKYLPQILSRYLDRYLSFLFPQNLLELKALSVPDQSTFFCCCSVAQSCPSVYDPMKHSLPGFPILHCLPEFAQTHVRWVSDAIQPPILCHPHLLLPSLFPSIRVFSSESVLSIRWPKYWSFSFSISPSNEYSGLISFRIDWFDFLAVQGTLKSLLQHHSSKASILWCSAFFKVQLLHPYLTTGKT